MEILADPKIQREVGVSETNYFVFASSQLSELNFSGWHAVKETCREVTLLKPNLINATNNRHCVSTIYIYLNVVLRLCVIRYRKILRTIIKTHYPLHAKLRHSSLHLIFTFNYDHEQFFQFLMSSLHLLFGLPLVRLPSNVARTGSVYRYNFNFLVFISFTIGFSLVTSHRYVNGVFSISRLPVIHLII